MPRSHQTMETPYSLLGIAIGASPTEIKYAYRRAALQNHPDKFLNPTRKAQAEERMKKINGAYDSLKRLVNSDDAVDNDELFFNWFGHRHTRYEPPTEWAEEAAGDEEEKSQEKKKSKKKKKSWAEKERGYQKKRADEAWAEEMKAKNHMMSDKWEGAREQKSAKRMNRLARHWREALDEIPTW